MPLAADGQTAPRETAQKDGPEEDGTAKGGRHVQSRTDHGR